MNPPAFQFYADDFLAGTISMTRDERGLYIVLLCLQWNCGFVTDSDFARLGDGMAEPSLNYVKTKFVRSPEGQYRNERMEKVRREQETFREQKRLAGLAGADKRWHTHSEPNGKPLAKNGSPSPSPSPSPNVANRTSNYSGTKLTFLSLDRIAREIVNNDKDWDWDNCKVKRSSLVASSIVSHLKNFVGAVPEASVHPAWREAVVRSHQASVDGLIKTTVNGYCMRVFSEQLTKSRVPAEAEVA
jgi:uncharacterized protein YdaU (DUF1376 family)